MARMLRSVHAPHQLCYDWERVVLHGSTEPSERSEIVYCNHDDLMIFWFNNMWVVAQVTVGYVVAAAISTALHPQTVWPGEWYFQTTLGTWNVLPNFCLRAQLAQSDYHPFLLDDIGVDFFERVQVAKPIYWIDPNGRTQCSGAKRLRGVRYCSECRENISANNFVSQHICGRHKRTDERVQVKLCDVGWGTASPAGPSIRSKRPRAEAARSTRRCR